MATTPLKVKFSKERETLHTWRYQEDLSTPSDTPVVGTLYLRHAAVKALGEPSSIEVTIAAK